MSTSAIMFALGLSYFVAHLFQYLFSRYRVPDVLLFMLIGLVLGPITGFVDKSAFGRSGDALSALALVLILFNGGAHLDIKAFKQAWLQTLGLTLATSLATGAIFFVVGMLLGLSAELSLILGAILSGTSSAVVIPMIEALKVEPATNAMATIESALTDVLCIVLTASLIQAHTNGEFAMSAIAGSIGIAMLGAAVFGFGLGLCWLFVCQYTQRVPNTAFATLAFGLLVYGLAEAMNISGGITVMAYGFALANGKWMLKRNLGMTSLEMTFYSELIFVLKTFFFIYLGTSLLFMDIPIVIVSLLGTAAVFALRVPLTRVTVSRALPLRDRSYLALMIPKGLAAAVLASIPAQKGIPGGERVQLIVYSVVFFSILLCALLVPLMEQPKAIKLMSHLLGRSPTPPTS